MVRLPLSLHAAGHASDKNEAVLLLIAAAAVRCDCLDAATASLQSTFVTLYQ